MKNFDSPEERDNAARRKMQRFNKENMEKYGWYAHHVFDDEQSPTGANAHTHGFEETWNHPDIQIVYPIPGNVAHGIFWTVVGHLKEGKRYEPGIRYGEILENYDVMFAWAQEGGRRVLRMILPDPDNVMERGRVGGKYATQWKGTEE